MNFIKDNIFLFKELVKRDFKKRYKGTILGVIWSILYPILDLVILVIIFTKLLGRDTPHYPIYVFCGTIIMSFFRDATKQGLNAFRNNRNIIKKVKMQNILFVLSKNVSSLINFLLTLIVFVVLCIVDGIEFKLSFVLVVFPIICLTIFNIGVSLILSTAYVFFRDISYIYDLLLIIINYLSATFYRIDSLSKNIQKIFILNPIYCYIQYFRDIVLNNTVPSFLFHGICLLYAIFYLSLGLVVYNNHKKDFIYNL